MPAKLKEHGVHGGKPGKLYAFHCPGCGHDHGFWVGNPDRPNWAFNGSLDKPTFTPSLLCNQSSPENRCHSFVTDGKIKFLADCFHELKGQTVDLPDWDD